MSWKQLRLMGCLAAMLLLLGVAIAGRFGPGLAEHDRSLPRVRTGDGTRLVTIPFRDPHHADPFARLWRQIDQWGYSYHLYRQGILLRTDQWKDG